MEPDGDAPWFRPVHRTTPGLRTASIWMPRPLRNVGLPVRQAPELFGYASPHSQPGHRPGPRRPTLALLFPSGVALSFTLPPATPSARQRPPPARPPQMSAAATPARDWQSVVTLPYGSVSGSTALFCAAPMYSPTVPYGPHVVRDWQLLPWRQSGRLMPGGFVPTAPHVELQRILSSEIA